MKKLCEDLLIITAFSFFAYLVFGAGFMLTKTLFHDNFASFSVFRDNLHSLNHFGEIAWWFPHNQCGFPNYWISILGGSIFCIKPAGSILGLFVWILGRIGIEISSYYIIYTIFFAFFEPFLVTLGVYFIARQIFQPRLIIVFCVIMSSFSPGVMLNISDIGVLEPAAYSLYFFAACIYLIRRPGNISFLLLCFTGSLLAISFNFAHFFWNIVAIPTFIIVALFIPKTNFSKIKRSLLSFPYYYWFIFFFVLVITILPTIIAYLQIGDLVRSKMGGTSYLFSELDPGNPLEMLTVSLSGFAFEWGTKHHPLVGLWELVAHNLDHQQFIHLSINYMGILCLPLTIIGLLYGKTIKGQLFCFLAITFGIACLSSYSPFMYMLMVLFKPLQSNSHFSDLIFRAGGYLILIFASAEGLKTIAEGNSRVLKMFVRIILLLFFVYTIIHIAIVKGAVTGSIYFGFMIFLTFLFVVLLKWLIDSRNKLKTRRIMIGLFLLLLLDLSTYAFLHVRSIIDTPGAAYINQRISEEKADDLMGTKMFNNHPHINANTMIMYNQYLKMRRLKFEPKTIDKFRLFNAAHINENMEKEIRHIKNKGFDGYKSLVLSPKGLSKMSNFTLFLDESAKSHKDVIGHIKPIEQTYNSYEFDILADQTALFFIRDAYSPFWKAWINGEKVNIARALYNFKAVVVPEGESKVVMKFSPPLIKESLFFAYFVIIILGILVIMLPLRKYKCGK